MERLPSGSWRVKVYAWTEPLTSREIRLRKTCKTKQLAGSGGVTLCYYK
jgi:hypothetical protein